MSFLLQDFAQGTSVTGTVDEVAPIVAAGETEIYIPNYTHATFFITLTDLGAATNAIYEFKLAMDLGDTDKVAVPELGGVDTEITKSVAGVYVHAVKLSGCKSVTLDISAAGGYQFDVRYRGWNE